MNWAPVILGMMLFYGVLGVLFAEIGDTMKTNEDFAQIVTGQDVDIQDYPGFDIVSYQHLVQDTAKEILMDQFIMGEYNLSDGIEVHHVWHSEKKLDTRKEKIDVAYDSWFFLDPDWWGHHFGNIKRWLYGEDEYEEWIDNHRTNISYNEQVYIYPHFTVNLGEVYPSIWRYVVVNAWDVYGNKWTSNPWTWEPWIGGTANIVARLDAGKMPKRDFYYCIDFIRADTDIRDYFTLSKFLEIGRAEIVERYGGVIYGDESVEMPLAMQVHELTMRPDSGFNKLVEWIGNIGIGFQAFQGYGLISILFDILIATPLLFMTAYILYYEARDWIPFVGGG